MFTRCPKCQTVFTLTQELLGRRNGLVRCGVCEAIFYADKHLTKTLPEEQAPTDSVNEPAREAPKPPSKPTQKNTALETTTTVVEQPQAVPTQTEIPTISALLHGKSRRRVHPFFWALGNVLLIMALAVQTMFFYSNELTLIPELSPWIKQACLYLKCEIEPQQNINLIEVQNTSIAPHPTHRGSLRVRSAIINRADFAQAFPLLEVSFTDSKGRTIARRTFKASQYLEKKEPNHTEMLPNVVVKTLQDITSPGKSVVGYEIQVVSP